MPSGVAGDDRRDGRPAGRAPEPESGKMPRRLARLELSADRLDRTCLVRDEDDAATRSRTRPLAGVRVVVTRARDQAGPMVRRLESLGAEAILAPTIEIVPPADPGPLDAACARVGTFDWVVFTSVNAVACFVRRLAATGGGVRDLRGVRLCAVGAATAEALAAQGLRTDLVPDEYRSEGVLRALRGRGALAGSRVLLPRGNLARDLLPTALRRAGAEVTAVTAYRTTAADLEGRAAELRRMLGDGRVDVVTFTSGSSVRNFVRAVGEDQASGLLRRAEVACIGPVTAEAASRLDIAVTIVPAESTVPALLQAITDRLARTDEEEA